jgi:hypothetical protein
MCVDIHRNIDRQIEQQKGNERGKLKQKKRASDVTKDERV